MTKPRKKPTAKHLERVANIMIGCASSTDGREYIIKYLREIEKKGIVSFLRSNT